MEFNQNSNHCNSQQKIQWLQTKVHGVFSFLIPFVCLVIWGAHLQNQGQGTQYFVAGHRHVFDLFVFYKTIVLVALVSSHLLISFSLLNLRMIARYKLQKTFIFKDDLKLSALLNIDFGAKNLVFFLALVYLVHLSASTILNGAHSYLILGFYEHYEGYLSFACYIYLFVFFLWVDPLHNTKTALEKGVVVSSTLLGFIGITQYFGHALWDWPWLQKILHSNLPHQIQISSLWKAGSLSTTLFNPNWAGFYFAFVGAWAFCNQHSFRFLKPWMHWAWFGWLIICLSASGSRSAYFALSIVVSVSLIKILFLGNFKQKLYAIALTTYGAFISTFVLSHRGQPLALESQVAFQNTWTEMRSFNDSPIGSIDPKDRFFVESRGQILLLQDFEVRYRIQIEEGKLRVLQTTSVDAPHPNVTAQHESNAPKVSHFVSHPNGAYTATVSWKNTTLNLLFNHEGIRYFLWGQPVQFVRPATHFDAMDDHFASNRGYIWKRILPIALKSPWLGTGPDSFANVFPQNDFGGKLTSLANHSVLVEKPHNLFLGQLVNGGFPSLILFILIFFMAIVFGQNDWDIKAGLLVFVIAGIFNDGFVPLSSLAWAIAGLSFCKSSGMQVPCIQQEPTNAP